MADHKISQNFVIKSESPDGIIIRGYASVYSISDKHNDIIIHGAFSPLPSITDIKLLWQHDQSKPIGSLISILEDEYGLEVEAEIKSEAEIIALVISGKVNGLSVGFNIEESYYNEKNQRIITKAQLSEISVVNTPANEQACIDDISDVNELESSLSKLGALMLETNKFLNQGGK